MRIYVAIEEAAERLEELLDAAVAGEEVIITDDGVPKVRLDVDRSAPSEERSSAQRAA